eukprot:1936_1
MMTFFEIILIAANLSVQSSGIPTILSIIEKESINANESPFLFIMLIINGLIGCTYSILTSQTVMFVSQICAIVFGIIYLYTFHHYSVTERKQQIQLYIQFIIIGFIFVSTFVIFTFYHNEHIVIQFVGILGLLSAIMLMSSPLCVMKAVIRDGTSIYLPKTTVIATFISAFTWLMYGLAKQDEFVWIPNGIGLIASVIQIYLLLNYPAKHTNEELIQDIEHLL